MPPTRWWNVQPVLSFMPPTRWSKVRPVLQIIHEHYSCQSYINIHEHHSCQSYINIHEHHSCQSASKASFTELQLRKFFLQSSSFKSFIYKSSSFKSFIYRALASKLHLQSFTYKASVQGIQIPPPNNRHFGPYMDSIWSLQPTDSIDRRLGGLHYVPYIGPQLGLMKNTWGT